MVLSKMFSAKNGKISVVLIAKTVKKKVALSKRIFFIKAAFWKNGNFYNILILPKMLSFDENFQAVVDFAHFLPAEAKTS